MNAPAFAAAVSLLVVFSTEVDAAERKIPAAVVYEAIAATNATIWLAEDLKLFDKYGFDMKGIQGRGAGAGQAPARRGVGAGARRRHGGVRHVRRAVGGRGEFGRRGFGFYRGEAELFGHFGVDAQRFHAQDVGRSQR